MRTVTRNFLLIACSILGSGPRLNAQLSQACLTADLGEDEILWGMELDGNGGYILVGHFQPDGPHAAAEIAHISGDGTLIRGMISVHDDHGAMIKAVARTQDGGFAVVGQSGADGVYQLLIAKFNSEVELLWSRSVGEQVLSGAVGIALAVADNGDLFVAGSRTDASINYRPFVLTFDSEGTLLWKSMYEFSATIDGEATAIAALPSGGCVVTGYQYDDLFTVAHGWIMRLDNTGQVIWSRTTPPGARFDALVASNDGGHVLSGGVEAPFVVNGDYNVCMVKIDANGQLIWDVIVGTEDIEFATAIARTADEGFVAGGATFTDGVDPKAYLVKVNGNGELRWTRKIGGTGSNYECFGVKPTTSNGLALAVRSTDGSERDMGLVLTDDLGMPCPACGVDSGGAASQGITFEDHAVTLLPIADTIPRVLVFAESGTSSIICDGVGLVEIASGHRVVMISPQPLTTSAQVMMPEEWSRLSGTLFLLRDALGRVVRRTPVVSSTFTLERGDLSAGLFAYELSQANTKLASGTLVVQ